jgi:predicted dehydrogenase
MRHKLMAQPISRGISPPSRPTRRLGIGVLGLGRRWQSRYLPALRAMRDRFTVRAVADPVAVCTDEEARKLDCDAMAGPTELFENPSVEAVLLLDEAWYGLWPIEAACRVGKPVFCAAVGALATESKELCRKVQDRQLPVLMALPPRLAAATRRALQLVQTELGPVRVIVGEGITAGEKPSASPLLGRSSLGLVDACLSLLGSPPISVQSITAASGDVASMLIDLADGSAAQIVRTRGASGASSMRLTLPATHGSAVIELPRRVRWQTPAGQHLEHLPRGGSPTRLLLEHFHQAITEDSPMRPNLDDAWTAMQCLRAAAESISSNDRRVMIA